ncbi:MAG: glycosyltransferase family 1 protein [Saprospiraceae bacterium]|nr:glycosyltransferase family 1 protein [Saprospiraceae bacterium]
MRILFDHQVFSWQTYGGVSRYFVAQMLGLKALGQEVILPENFYSENVYLRSLPDFQRKSLTPFSFKGKKILQNVLGRKASLEAIRRYPPDVFHPTYFDPYFLKTLETRSIRFVLTVHDMIHEIYGHGSRSVFSLDAQVVENKRFLAGKADAIIAVSENTRRDLLRFCPEIDPSKVYVIHHGNSLQPDLEAQNPGSKVQSPPFLLFVGQRKTYKNFAWMLEQIAGLLHSVKDLELICVGGSHFDKAENEQLARLGVAHKVRYQSVGSDAELAKLYSQAMCFIFPSQYEGFGIPVLEAFACGCPVVLNRASSLPEVGAEAASYFDENTSGSLEAEVRRLLEDTDYRRNRIEMGLERVKAFTWEQSAKKHLAVYQTIVN